MVLEYELVIVNGVVVTDTDIGEYDIAINNEKIEKITTRGGLGRAKAKKTIDAEGGYVMVLPPQSHVAQSRLTSTSQAESMLMSTFKSRRCLARDRLQTTMRRAVDLQCVVARPQW